MKQKSKGFTIFELLVSIAIFTILTIVVLVKNSEFKGTILTTNLAYDVALGVREAQVYGIDVNSYSASSSLGPNAFSHAFGIHFDNPSAPSLCHPGVLSSLVFCIYGDVNDNHIYDPSAGQDVNVETDQIAPGNSILDFCAVASGVTYCSDGDVTDPSANAGTTLTYLDITFKRPDPSAIITTNVATGMTSAKINVESTAGIIKTVDVSSIGQISIEGE